MNSRTRPRTAADIWGNVGALVISLLLSAWVLWVFDLLPTMLDFLTVLPQQPGEGGPAWSLNVSRHVVLETGKQNSISGSPTSAWGAPMIHTDDDGDGAYDYTALGGGGRLAILTTSRHHAIPGCEYSAFHRVRRRRLHS